MAPYLYPAYREDKQDTNKESSNTNGESGKELNYNKQKGKGQNHRHNQSNRGLTQKLLVSYGLRMFYRFLFVPIARHMKSCGTALTAFVKLFAVMVW